ncbi:MAG: serine/threonine protein kinase, partial [Candidatus Sericytochromatia bacterium]|nr:serine/threonine protein kinase [Candidatus Sericytochromatia bacterium]
MVSYPELESIIGEKYQIKALIGKGATAFVYKATHRYLQTDIALKILSPELSERDKKIEDIFFEEASHLSKMDHPNLVRVLDADKMGGYSYIAMELLYGVSLEQMIKDKIIIKPTQALKIIRDVCYALEYSLTFGFVHRDVKPANIMIMPDDKVKILDFGLSKKIGQPVKYQIIGGPMCGTLYYMSPEQLTDSDRVDQRADLYSIGATLYHAIIGKVPFETNNLSELVSMQINNIPVPPVNLSPDVSYELSSMIMKLLEKSASKRYST